MRSTKNRDNRPARPLAVTLLVTALLCLSAPAFAEDPPAEASGARTHDGLHVVIGVGPSYFTASVSLDPAREGLPDSSISALGVGGMLLIGGTVAPGLVVGGGTMGAHHVSPTISVGDLEADTDGDISANLIGPYVDYYLYPDKGFHVMAMLGLGTMEDGDDDTDDLALGFGLAGGLGHNWWVADQWSVGILGRMQVMFLSASTAGPDVNYTTVIPAIMATVTYH